MKLISLLAAVVTLSLTACGTPCAHIGSAENNANEKGKACNSKNTDWDTARVQRCESGLSKCSQDDQKQMDAYAQCLNNLAVCVDGQSLSWSLSRIGCVEPLTKISLTCLDAIK